MSTRPLLHLLLIPALMISSLPLHAQGSWEMSGQMPRTVSRVEAVAEMLKLVDELTNLLKGVNNRTQGDAAARQVADIHRRIMVLHEQVIYMKASPQELQLVRKTYGNRINTAFRELETQARRVARTDGHGSKALVYALTFGMVHPYLREVPDNIHGDAIPAPAAANDKEQKKLDEKQKAFLEQQGNVPPDVKLEYKKAYDAATQK